MAKDTYYFPHDYEPTSDPKIQALIGEYGAAGYGLYWRVVEMLHSDEKHELPTKKYIIVAIAKQMLSTADFINKFLSDCVDVFELFTQIGDVIKCDRVMRNIEKREDIISKRKAAGSKGGVANAKQLLSKAKAKSSKGKERKGKESKIKENNKENKFSLFWQAYGKPVDRKKCLEKFALLQDDEIDKALLHVPNYVLSTAEVQYRKNPLTYINGQCWNDEVKTEVPKKDFSDPKYQD